MSIAFVIGNGTSRKPIDLNQLKTFGKIYACNAVYREMNPDYLIAVDSKMITEINRSQYRINHEVWTNPNKLYKGFHKFNYFKEPLGWSSGPTALWLASNHKEYDPHIDHNHIFILGFDYRGSGGLINNLYADTENYKKSTDPETYHGNWARQTGIVIQRNYTKKYTRVTEFKSDYCPDGLQQMGNLNHMTVQEFMEYFKIS